MTMHDTLTIAGLQEKIRQLEAEIERLRTRQDIVLSALPTDLRKAAATLGTAEVRYLVDSYYALQEFRKASSNQVRALAEGGEPHLTVRFISSQFETVEAQIKGALDHFSRNDPMGVWSRKHVGIGPVIAAGLSAHIDITKAPTVGHIWRFAGLDPTVRWEKGQKRPWNADLKVLCWKIGDSFVKFSGRKDCFYGQVYRSRKAFELERDAAGGHAQQAAETLERRNIRDKETRAIYEAGRLPAGRLDLRARRVAVKLFLSHWHAEAYRQHFGTEPPLPYAITQLGHGHYIPAPEV